MLRISIQLRHQRVRTISMDFYPRYRIPRPTVDGKWWLICASMPVLPSASIARSAAKLLETGYDLFNAVGGGVSKSPVIRFEILRLLAAGMVQGILAFMVDLHAIRQGPQCKAYHTCPVRPDALLVYGMSREADDIGFDCRLV